MPIDYANLGPLDFEVQNMWRSGKRPVYVSEGLVAPHFARDFGELLECYVLWDKPKARYELTDIKPVIDEQGIVGRPNIVEL